MESAAGRRIGTNRQSVSIVIATRDRPDRLRNCLEAVRLSIEPNDEIIVVDSASRDRSSIAEIARSFGARHFRCDEPGAARARNLGIESAKKDVVAFTDDDALPDENWIDALASPFADPAVGIVVGPVFLQGAATPRLLTEYPKYDAARERHRFRKGDSDWFARLRLGAIGSGANFAARRELLDRQGRFCECLGAGAPIAGDEIFFFLTAIINGETLVNEPSARVFHPQQMDDRKEEVLETRVAYWLFVIMKYPRLISRILPIIAMRIMGRRDHLRAAPRGYGSLLQATIKAPKLLLSAWRFSRWK